MIGFRKSIGIFMGIENLVFFNCAKKKQVEDSRCYKLVRMVVRKTSGDLWGFLKF